MYANTIKNQKVPIAEMFHLPVNFSHRHRSKKHPPHYLRTLKKPAPKVSEIVENAGDSQVYLMLSNEAYQTMPHTFG